MKRFFLFILSTLILISCNHQLTNDWLRDELQGRVKHISTTTGEAVQQGDTLLFGRYTYTEEIFYDKDGLKTYATTTDEEGHLNLKCIYEHDKQGHITVSDIRDVDDKPIMRNVFEYDKNGYLTKMYSVDADGHTDMTVLYENDSLGNQTKQTIYDHLGRVVYSENVKEKDDASTENAHYLYDEQGNWTQKITFQTDSAGVEYPTFLWRRIIEYY